MNVDVPGLVLKATLCDNLIIYTDIKMACAD